MNPLVHVSFASDPLCFIAPSALEKKNSLLIFTFISLCCLLKNYQGDHMYKQKENLYSVGVQTAMTSWRLQRHIFQFYRFIKTLHQKYVVVFSTVAALFIVTSQ